MDKWECLFCGYIYDPEKGDPERGIEPQELLLKILQIIGFAPFVVKVKFHSKKISS